MQRIGIAFAGAPFPVREMLSYVKTAEKDGFESVWVAEDYFLRDAISTMAVFAYATDRIGIGTGVINPYTRNPVLIAETMAALDELSGGRMILALGTGVPNLVEQMGIRFQRPMRMMRESVKVIRETIRAGAARERVSFKGQSLNVADIDLGSNPYFGLLKRFVPPRDKIPIYVAAMGPKMLQLAGEIGDGVLLGAGCSSGYVKSAVEKIRTGAMRAGRAPEEVDVASLIIMSVSKKGQFDAPGIKGYIAFLLAFMTEDLMKMSGVDPNQVEPIKKAFKENGIKEAIKYLPDEITARFCVLGSPESCLSKIREYVSAGVNLPIMLFLDTDVELALRTASRYLHKN